MLTLCRANGKARVEFISPRRAQRHEGREPSSWSLCSLWLKTGFINGLGGFARDGLPVLRQGRALVKCYCTGYRSVTLGNGNVLAEGAFFRHLQRDRLCGPMGSPAAEKLKRFKVIKSKKYKMKLKLGQIGLPNRMRRMAARWRKSRKNRSSLFCDSCAFSLLFRRCQVPDGQINRAPCQEYAQTSNHE